MEFLVIDLKPEPHFLCKRKHSDSEPEPIIFIDKNSAFREADKCNQGLVYPITNIMQISEKIKQLSKNRWINCNDLLDELLSITDEIV